MNAFYWLSPRIPSLNYLVKGQNLDPKLGTLDAFVSRAVHGGASLRFGFVQLILWTRELSCYDPRDRLFAIHSLMHADQREFIRPDYSQSVEDVYKATTLRWIEAIDLQRTDRVDFLRICFLPKEPSALKLPSWVPGLSLPQMPEDFSIRINSYVYSHLAKPFIRYNMAEDSLAMRGVKVATLQYVAPFNLNHASSLTEILKTFGDNIHALQKHVTDLESDEPGPSFPYCIEILQLGANLNTNYPIPLENWVRRDFHLNSTLYLSRIE